MSVVPQAVSAVSGDVGPPRRFGPYAAAGVLGAGGMGVVYRAVHTTSGERVALKTVAVGSEHELASIRREIHTLRRLRHPGVVRIVAEGVCDGVPWYAMDLLEGETLRTRLERLSARDLGGPPGPLDLLLRTAEVLAFVHSEGVVHGDLKPENIFLRPGDRPVLVDFGLAWRVPGPLGREVLEDLSRVTGTPAYMAPEQIRGEPIDARADLYALGCILFELIAGRPPFIGAAGSDVLMAHLSETPSPPSSVVPGVPRPLDDLVLAMLAKRPRDRVGHAHDVIAELERIAGATRLPGPARTGTPYLYRPSLVGRETLLARLLEAAEDARRGAGACVLLGGESGIGKTFVAGEFTRRCDGGVCVVVTSCGPVSGDGQARAEPLQAFRPLLQAIADRCVDRGEAAADRILGPRGRTLAIFEPSLSGLPGQKKYPPPAMLSGSDAREHVLVCLAETITAFASEQPLVLLIDDLQWADELTLGFLRALPAGWFAARPALVLATYRTEDAPAELDALRRRPDVIALELEGLGERHVHALVTEMLALEESPPALSGFLARQSQGNPFFVAEYLRTAVAEGILRRLSPRILRLGATGTALSQAALESLPLPGTVRDLVARRIDRLEGLARAMVDVACVLGREFDGDLAQHASGLAELESLEALADLLARQMLEQPAPGRYRFVHDKLAEIAYERLPEGRRRSLHRAVAHTLEARYPRETLPASEYARLAHHWSAAAERARALDYFARAGSHALAAAAYGDAASHLRRALALDEELTREGKRSVGAEVRAHWELGVARAEHGRGDAAGMTEAHATRALRLLGYRLPSSSRGWTAFLLFQFLAQGARLAGLGRTAPAGKRAARRLAAGAAVLLTHRYYFLDNAPALLGTSLLAANVAEQAGAPHDVPRAYLGLAALAGLLRRDRLARLYFETAHTGAERLNDPTEQAYCLATESVHHGTFGAWVAAEGAARQAEERLSGVHDPFVREIVLTTAGHVEYFTGRFTQALERYAEVLRSARGRANVQTMAWGLFSMARSLVALGSFAEALPLLEEARAMLERRPELQSEIICHGLLALVRLRLGQAAEARRLADETLARIRRARPTGFPAIVGYAAVLEVYCALMEEPEASRDAHLARALGRTHWALRGLSWLLPMGAPATLFYGAERERLRAHTARAQRLVCRSLRAAERLGMPYEQALAHLALGRLAPAPSPLRPFHLAEARRLFGAMGCAYHLRLVAAEQREMGDQAA